MDEGKWRKDIFFRTLAKIAHRMVKEEKACELKTIRTGVCDTQSFAATRNSL